jgi:altronate dehydratase
MTIISSPIDINKIPSSISIIIAGALIAAGIVVEPFVTDRGRFQASDKVPYVVLDTRTGCSYNRGSLWYCPGPPRR